MRFADDTYTESYISTIGVDYKIKTVELGGKTIKLQIWDTAGQERFRTITSSYYRGSHGMMIVYDTTDLKTFKNLDRWFKEVEKHADDACEVIVIGTKSDLVHKRVVETTEVQQLAANAFGRSVPVIETSAKEGSSVDQAFLTIAQSLMDRHSGKQDDGSRTVAELVQKYSLAAGKLVSGLIRFFFEDMLQSFCQCVFLCKVWHHVSLNTKVFTFCSILAGITTSLMGPVMEMLKVRQINKDYVAMEGGDKVELSVLGDDTYQPLLDADGNESSKAGPTTAVPAGSTGASEHADPEAPAQKLQSSGQEYRSGRQPVQIFDMSIPEFIRDRSTHSKHGSRAHCLLIVGALTFWSAMGLIPFIFDEKLTCGGNIPAGGHLLFFMTSIMCLLIEFWIVIHGRQGYLMFRNLHPKLVMGVVFSFLGRFDTYSDVTSCAMILKCDAITWWSIEGRKFWLPGGIELSQVSLFALVVGVFLFQALPGIILLGARKALPISLKLNEFNVLLATMDDDVSNDEVAE